VTDTGFEDNSHITVGSMVSKISSAKVSRQFWALSVIEARYDFLLVFYNDLVFYSVGGTIVEL